MYTIAVITRDITYIHNTGVSYNVYKLVVTTVESSASATKSNRCVPLLHFKSSITLKIA